MSDDEQRQNPDITVAQVPDIEDEEYGEFSGIRRMLKGIKKVDQGRMDPSDQGPLNLGVVTRGGKVVVVFEDPCAWFSMDPEHARKHAQMLLTHADIVEEGGLSIDPGALPQ